MIVTRGSPVVDRHAVQYSRMQTDRTPILLLPCTGMFMRAVHVLVCARTCKMKLTPKSHELGDFGQLVVIAISVDDCSGTKQLKIAQSKYCTGGAQLKANKNRHGTQRRFAVGRAQARACLRYVPACYSKITSTAGLDLFAWTSLQSRTSLVSFRLIHRGHPERALQVRPRHTRPIPEKIAQLEPRPYPPLVRLAQVWPIS